MHPHIHTHTYTHTHTFRHTAGVSSSHHNKHISSYKLLSRNEWLWSSGEKLHPTICTLTSYCFTYNAPNTFTVQFPNLVTVRFLLFIKSQFTTFARNIFHLTQRMHWHVWSQTVAYFQRSWRFANGLAAIRNALLLCPHICNRAECTRAVEYPHTSESNGLRSARC
jgi:hypothetical protein